MKKPNNPSSPTNMASYMKDIPRTLLTKKEQLYYGRMYRTGGTKEKKEAMERLVSSSLYFVINIAKNMGYVGLEMEDLIQEGNIGLIKAVERYDYEKGLAFTTYAIWWVRQSILKAAKDKATHVRLPSHVYDLERRINNQEKHLERKGIPLDIKTLAKKLGKKIEQIQRHKVHLKMRHTLNLEKAFFGKDNASLNIDSKELSVFDKIAKTEVKSFIHALLERGLLTPREADVICLRYGFVSRLTGDLLMKYKSCTYEAVKKRPNRLKNQGLTLAEVSRIMHLSKERVRQLEVNAIRRLKAYRHENHQLFSDLI